MKIRKSYFLVSIVLLVSMVLSACKTTPATEAPVAATEAPVATEAAATAAPTEAPIAASWLDKIVFTAIADAEPAVAQLQAGTIDMYSATIDKADVYKTVTSDANLKSANTYGSSDQLLLNTAACADTTVLNPFNDQKIREALNWAVDRNYVVQDLFSGLAKAKFNPFTTAFPDYARYADLFSAIETKYAYDLEKAKAVVDEEMPKLGATLGADGKWQYQDKPVVIVGLIRTEDLRKEIGNYFANQLEALGFTVDRQEKDRKSAAPIWQQDDPTLCTFSYYTAGWISPQIYRDEGLNFIQYNTGQLQQLPVMNAYTPSEELSKVNEDLYTNNFANMDERRALFAKGLDLSMQESYWGIWVVDTISFEAYSAKAMGASDLAGGFGGAQLFPYTAQIEGQTGGEMRIANSAILVQAWNPVSGSNWIDDTIVRNFTVDYGVIYNPYTGLVMPKLVDSATVEAVTGLPIAAPQSDWVTLNFSDTIAVPDDAWVDWDAKTQKFITAAEKKAADPTWEQTAKTKTSVVYTPDLWKSTWHDGTPLTEADFIFNMIMTFDPGKADSAVYDESLGAAVETYLTHFKGVKIVSTDPLTIETYDDLYALDAENNIKDWYPNIYGATAFAGGMLSWHNLTPALQAEADGKMAFGQDKSTTMEVDQTSQISGPTVAIQMEYVDKDITDKYIPYAATMGDYVTADDAVAAYNNLKTFFAAHNHIVLGTGPYLIDQVYPVEGSITAVKYDAYAYAPGQFTGFAAPKVMTMFVDGPSTIKAGDEASFTATITYNDEPYAAADIDKVSYTLFNSDGSILGTGDAEFVADGQYDVKLTSDQTSKLTEGSAKLSIAAASKVVSLPTFETSEFVVTK